MATVQQINDNLNLSLFDFCEQMKQNKAEHSVYKVAYVPVDVIYIPTFPLRLCHHLLIYWAALIPASVCLSEQWHHLHYSSLFSMGG